MSKENVSGKDLVRRLKWKADYINWLIDDFKKVSDLNRHTSLMISRGNGNILSFMDEVNDRVGKKIAQLENLNENQLLTDEELARGIVEYEVELRERERNK